MCDGKFVDVDLGDNYPRGIICHYNDESKVVYTFKTCHSEDAEDYGGKTHKKYYLGSVKGGVTRYRWSNDNNTYTELASPAFVADKGSLGFFFLGEKPALDNKIVGDTYNCPRQIGFVKTTKDFSKVLSNGPEEIGGYYTFGGDYTS